MNYTDEAWEEEQMSNLGCESVSDLIEEVKRLRGIAKTCLEAIEAGGDIRSGTIKVIEHNLKEMIE